jgi:hypothetical protein
MFYICYNKMKNLKRNQIKSFIVFYFLIDTDMEMRDCEDFQYAVREIPRGWCRVKIILECLGEDAQRTRIKKVSISNIYI